MKLLKEWLDNARSVSLAQSVTPAVLAAAFAAGKPGFNPVLALIAVAGVLCAHLGMNLADDYFDYHVDMLSDRDRVTRRGFRAMMVKYPYLTDGRVAPEGLRKAIAAFFGAAGLCGAVVFVFRSLWSGVFTPQGSWWIAAIASAAAFLGIFYSAPPLKLAYRGLGELVIGIIFGPLLMLGVYYSACGEIGSEVVWASVPVGLLVLNILFTHSFIERESDAASNKMTFARLLGTGTANMAAAYVMNFLPYVLVTSAVAAGYMSPLYLLELLTFPVSAWLCRSLRKFNRGETGVPDRPPFWLGPTGNWNGIRDAGIDWFMMRWLAARNILSGFCIIMLAVRLTLLFL